jgi:hypothetical protein
LGQKPRRLGRDSSLASNDLIDPLDGDTEVLGQCDLTLAQGYEKLLAKNLAGVSGNAIAGLHG